MTDRRTFLTKSGLALGALIVGDEVLEVLDRLTHRKVFALGGLPIAWDYKFLITDAYDWKPEGKRALVGFSRDGKWSLLQGGMPEKMGRAQLAYAAAKALIRDCHPLPSRIIRV